jgi:hypothetical protein
MNVLTKMGMPLYRREYKRLVSGEDCQIVAKETIKQLLERTMDVVLKAGITEHSQQLVELFLIRTMRVRSILCEVTVLIAA